MFEGTQLIGREENPYHLSVAFAVTRENKIALVEKSTGYVSLPRETVYLSESLYTAVSRGCEEELGIEADIGDFLGSTKTNFKNSDGIELEKTTLYFSCTYLRQIGSARAQEKYSWLEYEDARKKLTTNGDFQEFEIVDRVFKKNDYYLNLSYFSALLNSNKDFENEELDYERLSLKSKKLYDLFVAAMEVKKEGVTNREIEYFMELMQKGTLIH